MLLKVFRKKMDYTQEDVAKILKISTRHYQNVEAGKGFLRQEKLNALEDLFRVPQRVLLAKSKKEVPDYLQEFLP
ncbi:putative transcriptional regulator [Bacillus sp. TS-2]|nr:putative transcriptional regulator [Bacillus sp. TS-2]